MCQQQLSTRYETDSDQEPQHGGQPSKVQCFKDIAKGGFFVEVVFSRHMHWRLLPGVGHCLSQTDSFVDYAGSYSRALGTSSRRVV